MFDKSAELFLLQGILVVFKKVYFHIFSTSKLPFWENHLVGFFHFVHHFETNQLKVFDHFFAENCGEH